MIVQRQVSEHAPRQWQRRESKNALILIALGYLPAVPMFALAVAELSHH
jgi:hypothetical protein